MKRFEIDFIEFSFLVEACIPPRPIARAMFWDDLINKHYHDLTYHEASRLFEWINRNEKFDLSNEDCQLFNARFDPNNQFEVKTIFEGKEETFNCFKWKDAYYTSKTKSVVDGYIVDVKKT